MPDNLKYYTNWTFYIWGVWLTCIVYSQIIYSRNRTGTEVATNSSSLFNLWKVCSALFAVSLVHSITVTLLYFGLLYPTLDPNRLDMTDYMKHSIPTCQLCIEFLTNSIVIEQRYYLPVIIFGLNYLFLLIGYTTTGDRSIYSIMKL